MQDARALLIGSSAPVGRRVVFVVKTVQDSMDHWSKTDAGDHDYRQATIQRVEAGEELAREGGWVFERPHAAQQHGCIQKGINPA